VEAVGTGAGADAGDETVATFEPYGEEGKIGVRMAGLFGHRWKAPFCPELPVLRTVTLERLRIQSRISFKNSGPRAVFGWRSKME
jgi:hypothetical protein